VPADHARYVVRRVESERSPSGIADAGLARHVAVGPTVAPQQRDGCLLGIGPSAYNWALRLMHCPKPFPMQYPWIHVSSAQQQEWLLKRNCSLAPRQLALIFASLATVCLAIAAVFTARGAWVVLPFACIEVLALGAAFFIYARHAADYERIVLCRDCLLVETCRAERLRREECTPAWTRVEYTGTKRELIGLVAKGRRIEVGRFVPESDRPDLARQLRAQLQGIRP
jgi:uncharacterized membrane protein